MKNLLEHFLRNKRLLVEADRGVPGQGLEQRLSMALLYSVYEKQLLSMVLSLLAVVVGGPAVLYTFGYYPEIQLWIGSIFLCAITGLAGYFAFARSQPGPADLGFWQRVFFTQCAFTGVCWGTGPVLAVLHDLPIDIALFMAALLGICACCLVLLNASLGGLLVLMATILLPFSLAIAVGGGGANLLVAMVTLIVYVVMSAGAFYYHRSLRNQFMLRFEAEDSAMEARKAREQAELANSTKSRFLANMSHELRTPMNAILGLLGLLQMSSLNARQLDYLDKTEGAARSLLSLLNDILDFSKIESGKFSIDPHPFRVDRLMEDLSVLQSASLGSKPLELRYDIDPTIPLVLNGDAMRLRQVLINITNNAIKFTDHGEVVVSLAVLSVRSGLVTVRFSVRDTGIGIPVAQQERIFEEFAQAHLSGPHQYGGTGLGLAICTRLVEMMGGKLQVNSTPGEGSTFWFDLSLESLEGTSLAQSVVKDAHFTEWDVLAIDDNTSSLELLARQCGSIGWRAETTHGGSEALALCRQRLESGQKMFDLVLLDWDMPNMDGWATLSGLRQLVPAHQRPLVVMVAPWGLERLTGRPPHERDWIDGFLRKPYTTAMLFGVAQDALTRRNQPVSAAPVQVVLPKPARLLGVHILLVDDNALNQQVASDLLQLEGAEVTVVDNGALALQVIQNPAKPIDLVLMDWQMPVMDGLTATRYVRNTLKMPSLPIIAMTANAMASDREECLQAGMQAHIGKPFSRETLVWVIKKHLPMRQVDEQSFSAR